MKNFLKSSFVLYSISALLLIFAPTKAWPVEITTPETKTVAGQTFQIPFIIDRIDNLAGVKVVLSYDKKLITYKKGERGEKANSLMQVINDKTPGRLVVVMAGAQGIKGESIPIFNLTFESTKEIKEPLKTAIAIEEIQLMSDDLKDIKCETKTGDITITP